LRTYHHTEFDASDLAAAKDGRTVSVVIPAHDEEATIGDIVGAIRAALVDEAGLVDELVVIDDRSADRTRSRAVAAGATVHAAADVLSHLPPAKGKGEALWKGVAATTGDVIAFVDGDLADFDPRFVVGLLGPLLEPDEDQDVGFVKAFYERPLDGQPRGGGRVTELAARPVISILLPHLGDVIQPLSGEFAATREVLSAVPFVHGYGVDIALLADVAARFGLASLAQVDLGRRVHRNRPIHELGPMATEVLLAALSRAGVDVPSEVRLAIPGVPVREVAMAERPPLADVAYGVGHVGFRD
jgi:glucosyl-3-phosphoglycerate synthase